MKRAGIRLMSIVYNLLGIIGLKSFLTAQIQWFGGGSFSWETQLWQGLNLVFSVFFLLSAWWMIQEKKRGFFIPLFLLSFFIAGNYTLLIPVLGVHLLFFLDPALHVQIG